MHKLIVVGTGIKSLAHITEETKWLIQNADKVLYLVNEELLKTWIQRESKKAESLESIYLSSRKRIDTYQAIEDYIIEQHQRIQNLCVVFYGHPNVFAQSALNAIKRINKNKGHAIILPAVSMLDCLYSDLQIDPGDHGCFIIDATELLIYERTLDKQSHVIICQASNLGMADTQYTQKLHILRDYLLQFYPANHSTCVYEAAVLPTHKPRIEWFKLSQLESMRLKHISTLYIPPIPANKLSDKYLKLLDMNISDFQLSSKSDTPSE